MRYQRQIEFTPFGANGQQHLSASRALVVGCGGLGSAIAQQLVRAGIGYLRIVDEDVVSLENLHRQFLFSEKDAEMKTPKIEAALRVLSVGNSDCQIDGVNVRFTEENADVLSESVDLILDGTDNFVSRFLLNRIAIKRNIPLITAGVEGTHGHFFTVLPKETPCFACLIDEKSVSNESSNRGILAPIVQVIASMQTMAAIKILSGNRQCVQNEICYIDLWSGEIRRMPFAKNTSCPVCGL